MSALKNISSIHELTHNYSLLKIEDQLELNDTACDEIKTASKDNAWVKSIQTINIYEKSHEYIITNELNENCVCLDPYEIKEFQKHYADKVHSLSIKNIVLHLENYTGLDDVVHGRMIRKNILKIRQFQNLKSLTYRYMGIPRHHLEEIADTNPDLEELCMINCSFDVCMDDVLLDVTMKLKNLKSLSIENFHRFSINYCRLEEILAMEKLECLQLTAAIIPNESVIMGIGGALATTGKLKELNIQVTIDPMNWPNNTYSYLQSFRNLSTLTIETVECLNDTTLQIIAEVCNSLETFNIHSTDFEEIEKFPLSSKVKILTLSWCKGLSCDNLRHVLTQLKITTFHSIETIYEGNFEGSRISPCITNLRVDGIDTQNFTFSYRNNNMEELTWFSPVTSLGQSVVNTKSLSRCNRLKTLDIQSGELSLETLLQLKSLCSVSLPQSAIIGNWSYMTSLLGHPTLKVLTLSDYTMNYYVSPNLDVPPPKGVVTNLEVLNIPLDVFEVAFSFFLDLMNVNKQLKRICCIYNPHDMLDTFLANLVYHRNFPKSVRSIIVNGFTIDCNDLRLNFLDSFNNLQSQIDNSKCWHDIEMYRIVLQK